MALPGQIPPPVVGQVAQGSSLSPALAMIAQAMMQGQGQPQGQGAFPGLQMPQMGGGIQTPGLAFGGR